MTNAIEYLTNVNGLKFISHWNRSKPLVGNIYYLKQQAEYEALETQIFRDHFKPGMTFLDVGAHVGYYTLLTISLGAKKVAAFEPDPKNRNQLLANIHLNDIAGKVDVFDCGLYDIETSANMKSARMKLLPNDDRFNLKDSDQQQISSGSSDFPETHTVVYDEFKGKIPIEKIDFIKMDIEGAEHNALKGMEQMLRSDRPVIVLSMHPTKMKPFGHKAEEVYQFLEGLGYRYETISRSGKDMRQSDDNYSAIFLPV